MQALKQVDPTAADVAQDSAGAAFLDSIAPQDTVCATGGTNCYYFHAYGSEYQDATINSQYFDRVLNLYNLASQVYATEHTISKDFAAALDSVAQLASGIRSSFAAVDQNNAYWEAMANVLAIAAGAAALSKGAPLTTGSDNAGFDNSNLESKLSLYLLEPAHPQNQTKANRFSQALGFDQSNWQDLAKQLYFDPLPSPQKAISLPL